jgi:hypothetical protein
MPEVILNSSRVVAVARELVSRTMSKHVRVNLEGHSDLLSRALHQPIKAIGTNQLKPSGENGVPRSLTMVT